MNEDEFWKIIEAAGSPSQCDPEEQCKAIAMSLSKLDKDALIEFENIRLRLLVQAYTWPMLKACFILLSYVSDDVFEDFRHWVILNGKENFYRTLKNPNEIFHYINVDDPIEEVTGEPLMMVVEEAWEGDIEEIEEKIVYPQDPEISDDWPPKDALRAEFPDLFDKFWNEKAIAEIHGK